MASGSRSIGSLSIDLIAKTFGFEQGLDKASRKAKSSTKEIEQSFNRLGVAIGASIAAAGAALTALTVNAINYADELQDLSAKLGVSTEQISKWAYAAELSGTDIDTVARSVGLLSKNLAAAADPTSKMGELFAALGVDVKDASGNLRSAEDVIPDLADRFKALDNQSTEAALAMQLFGKSGADLLEFLNRGSVGIADLGQELDDLGGVVSGDTAKAAEAFKEELGRIQIVGRGLGMQIAQQLLPALTDTAKEFRQLVKDGNLAANIVSILTTVMSAGTSVIEGYNIAVERTSLLFESGAKSAKGAIEAYKNFASLGFADGGVMSGLQQMLDAPKELQEEAKRLQAIREAQAKQVSVTLIDPGEGLDAWKQEKALAAEAAELQARINKLLEDAAGATNKASKAKVEKNTVDREAIALQRELAREAEEEAEMYRESLRLVKDNIAQAKEVADSLAFEIQLMGMSNREREKAIELSRLSIEGQMAYGDQIKQNIDLLYDQMERVEIMDGFRDSFKNFFVDVVSGTESVSDAFKNMLDEINRMLLNKVAENFTDWLFGAMGTNQTGAAGGNWFSMIAGWFAGGRANGGWAAANSMYEVNERGMEMATVNGRDYLLTGNQPVQITPNNRLGGAGMTQVVNFNVQGRIDQRTQDQVAFDVGRQTQVAMRRNG